MNAADFYESFKDALNFVGCGFQGMHLAKITYAEMRIIISYEGRSCSFAIPTEKAE